MRTIEAFSTSVCRGNIATTNRCIDTLFRAAVFGYMSKCRGIADELRILPRDNIDSANYGASSFGFAATEADEAVTLIEMYKSSLPSVTIEDYITAVRMQDPFVTPGQIRDYVLAAAADGGYVEMGDDGRQCLHRRSGDVVLTFVGDHVANYCRRMIWAERLRSLTAAEQQTMPTADTVAPPANNTVASWADVFSQTIEPDSAVHWFARVNAWLIQRGRSNDSRRMIDTVDVARETISEFVRVEKFKQVDPGDLNFESIVRALVSRGLEFSPGGRGDRSEPM